MLDSLLRYIHHHPFYMDADADLGSAAGQSIQTDSLPPADDPPSDQPNDGTSKTFSQAEVDQLIAAAVASKTNELGSMLGSYKKQREQAQAELKKLQLTQMSDADRIAAEHKDMQLQLQQLQTENETLKKSSIMATVKSTAAISRAIDPDAVVAILGERIFDDGADHEQMVKDLLKAKPYLQAAPNQGGSGNAQPGSKIKSDGWDKESRARKLKELGYG